MVSDMLKKVILWFNPEAHERFEALENIKCKYERLATKKVVHANSRVNFLAITYNKNRYWFMKPLPVVKKEVA